MNDLDEITRRRMDNQQPADYALRVDVRGYFIGDTGKVRWLIEPLLWSPNIDIEDGKYMAAVFTALAEVLEASE